MYRIKRDEIDKLFSVLSEGAKVYVPCKSMGKTDFAEWSEGAHVDLETLKTTKSAKEVFFPQCEDIVSFKKDGKNIIVSEAERMSEDFVVFGVRGCDARGFSILDRVFLSDPVDTFYEARRKHGTVVSMMCTRPEESCFCTAFGIDPSDPEGDVVCCVSDGWLYLSPKTEKGLNLIKTAHSVFEEVPDNSLDAERENIKNILSRLPLSSLDLSNWGEDGLLEKFNSPKWSKLSEACIGCGTCTFVCPTCQCYDVRDFDKGNGVNRYRCWDSCMYKDFTMMAHGTPRPTQMQRFRQRFMHKLVYFPSNNGGVFSCVGCGRCLDRCPMGLNIVKVIKAFGEKSDE